MQLASGSISPSLSHLFDLHKLRWNKFPSLTHFETFLCADCFCAPSVATVRPANIRETHWTHIHVHHYPLTWFGDPTLLQLVSLPQTPVISIFLPFWFVSHCPTGFHVFLLSHFFALFSLVLAALTCDGMGFLEVGTFHFKPAVFESVVSGKQLLDKAPFFRFSWRTHMGGLSYRRSIGRRANDSFLPHTRVSKSLII